ncbi:hypothetical protein [Hymenobacter sp. BT559]|uniref:hypothetical protein n=1 Tax=Hymenobacter sp. BT559 TaxID=2795729 RepID=UPI001AACB979|nr:hypothetical protein [Hymenobacter sp. BT559]
MTTSPENSQPSASKSPTPSPKSGTTSATLNPFQGPGAEEAWKRLLAQPGRVVSREEMIRRVQEQAVARKP